MDRLIKKLPTKLSLWNKYQELYIDYLWQAERLIIDSFDIPIIKKFLSSKVKVNDVTKYDIRMLRMLDQLLESEVKAYSI